MVLITLWLTYIFAEAYIHHKLILSGDEIDHGVAAWLRVMVAGIMFLLFGSGHLLGLSTFLLSAFFSFWLIFNLYLNDLRGLDWFYLGESAFLDRLEHKLRESVFGAFGIIILKAVLAIHFAWWYLYINAYGF